VSTYKLSRTLNSKCLLHWQNRFENIPVGQKCKIREHTICTSILLYVKVMFHALKWKNIAEIKITNSWKFKKNFGVVQIISKLLFRSNYQAFCISRNTIESQSVGYFNKIVFTQWYDVWFPLPTTGTTTTVYLFPSKAITILPKQILSFLPLSLHQWSYL